MTRKPPMTADEPWNMDRAKRIWDMFQNGDPNELAVWIGKNGCAVHPGGGEVYCQPVSLKMAHNFIRKHCLTNRDARRDGIAFTN